MDWRKPAFGEVKIMYSVLRFIGGEACTIEQLERIGNLLNASVPGAYGGPDRMEVRFSVTVSTAETWEDHEAAVIALLHSAEPAIREARLNDMTFELDTLVEPEDVQGKPYLTLPISLSFHEEVVRIGIALVFTFANPGS